MWGFENSADTNLKYKQNTLGVGIIQKTLGPSRYAKREQENFPKLKKQKRDLMHN